MQYHHQPIGSLDILLSLSRSSAAASYFADSQCRLSSSSHCLPSRSIKHIFNIIYLIYISEIIFHVIHTYKKSASVYELLIWLLASQSCEQWARMIISLDI